MHVVELQHVAQLLLFLGHVRAQGYRFYHVVGEQPIGDVALDAVGDERDYDLAEDLLRSEEANCEDNDRREIIGKISVHYLWIVLDFCADFAASNSMYV